MSGKSFEHRYCYNRRWNIRSEHGKHRRQVPILYGLDKYGFATRRAWDVRRCFTCENTFQTPIHFHVQKQKQNVSIWVWLETLRTPASTATQRNKIGRDVALEAMKDAWRTRKASADPLWRTPKTAASPL